MSRKIHAHCPSCREETPINAVGECLFCDTDTSRSFGGQKPTPLLYAEAQLRALHEFHWEHYVTIQDLARKTFATVGYGSKGTAENAIRKAWRQMGLPIRQPHEAMQAAFRRRGAMSADRPRCKATNNAKTGGGQCRRPASAGSDYCHLHDPARKDEVRRNALVASHARRDSEDTVPMEPLAAWLRELHRQLGSWERVGRRVGINETMALRYARGQCPREKPKTVIGRQTVERFCATAGVPFADLYPDVGAADPGESGRVVAGAV